MIYLEILDWVLPQSRCWISRHPIPCSRWTRARLGSTKCLATMDDTCYIMICIDTRLSRRASSCFSWRLCREQTEQTLWHGLTMAKSRSNTASNGLLVKRNIHIVSLNYYRICIDGLAYSAFSHTLNHRRIPFTFISRNSFGALFVGSV